MEWVFSVANGDEEEEQLVQRLQTLPNEELGELKEAVMALAILEVLFFLIAKLRKAFCKRSGGLMRW